jgi:hypothetical protein
VTRAERKAAIEAKRVAALADFHRRHRCCQCGAAANTIVVSGVRDAGSLKTRAVTRDYCDEHAPPFAPPSS